MAIIKYLVPALSVLSTAYGASCSVSDTKTIKSGGDASSIASCPTFTGNIVVQSGVADGGNLDFGQLRKIDGDFTYKGDSKVDTLSFEQLRSVGAFTLQNLTGLSSLNLGALETVGDLDLEGLGALGSLGFGSGSGGVQEAGKVRIINTFITSLDGLSNVSKIAGLTVSDNTHLQEISLSVDTIDSIDIGPNDLGNGGQTATFKNLKSADGIVVRNCTEVKLPKLSELTGSLQLIGNTFTNFTAPKLTEAGAIIVADNTKLQNISFPELGTINGSKSALVIANNTKLFKITGFDKLKTVRGAVGFQGNFSSVSFTQLQRIGGALYVDTASDTFDCSKILGLRKSQTVDGAIHCTKGDKTKIGGSSTGSTSSDTSSPANPLPIPSDFMAGFTLLAGILSYIL